MRSVGGVLLEKFCVFCGKPPENKNKEHVLPQWLLRETGDPTRVVKMGINYKTQKPIEFSWNSLTMPSCTSCNDEFSGLEGRIKPIIEALQRREGVTVENYILLMDWMDKVRVGLWLNYHVLQGNPTGIAPNFHIKERIGRKDRYLAVHAIDTEEKKPKRVWCGEHRISQRAHLLRVEGKQHSSSQYFCRFHLFRTSWFPISNTPRVHKRR